MILAVSSLLRHTLICPNGAVTGCGKSTTAGVISTTESSIESKRLRLMRSAPVDRSSVITRFSWISMQNSRSDTVNLIKVNERGCCEQYGFDQQERVGKERVLQQKIVIIHVVDRINCRAKTPLWEVLYILCALFTRVRVSYVLLRT